ncbi:negative regulator of beta-lactamase expression [Leptolyngbyaceae cyanobacterium JSC-12]|nr:negative regulator of beta-lactamase expression [Leptolyngbyaceae cyanobacterium JSC-12]
MKPYLTSELEASLKKKDEVDRGQVCNTFASRALFNEQNSVYWLAGMKLFGMKRNLVTTISLFVLCVMTLIITVNASKAQRAEFESPSQPSSDVVRPPNYSADDQSLPTDCMIRPEETPKASMARSSRAAYSKTPLSLLRFRQLQFTDLANRLVYPDGARPIPAYQPREEIVLIHPTNYGDRFLLDIDGNPANLDPIVVLHETVGSAASTINFFLTPHPRDEDQASYHTLIQRDGTIVYLVPPDKRAYGAGNSVFVSKRGKESVKTHAKFPPSVNNFAYHVSLETPPDGINNAYRHSGYTEAQYQSLAWLVSKTAVPDDRITTHKAVDRSGSRMDPRSFSFSKFFKLLQNYTKTDEIAIRCTIPPEALQSQRDMPAINQSTAKKAWTQNLSRRASPSKQPPISARQSAAVQTSITSAKPIKRFESVP